jgi:hypothetical protein
VETGVLHGPPSVQTAMTDLDDVFGAAAAGLVPALST